LFGEVKSKINLFLVRFGILFRLNLFKLKLIFEKTKGLLSSICFTFLINLLGCATYQGNVEKVRDLVANGQLTAALAQLEPLALKESDDQLVYLLDYATVLQIAGRFKESNQYFIKADKLSDVKDYTSLSRETGAILLNEEMVQYKGDDFEVILINAMTAINYLVLNDLESAMVEVRRLNEKLNRFRLEAKRKFTDNAFALYLSGIIYEASKQWDDAYIAYAAAFKLAPNYISLQNDLIRTAKKSKRIDEFKKWKKEFPLVQYNDTLNDSKYGELVVIFEQGWAPRKNFNPENYRYPKMYPVWSKTLGLDIKISSENNIFFNNSTDMYKSKEMLFSVERMAIESLEDQYASLIMRRMSGFIAKEIMSDQIRQKNETLGFVAELLLQASDRADLRQWSTLPRGFQVFRFPLKEGNYNFKIQGIDYSDAGLSGESWDKQSVQIFPDKKTFYLVRSVH
jgi:hypothetical protein